MDIRTNRKKIFFVSITAMLMILVVCAMAIWYWNIDNDKRQVLEFREQNDKTYADGQEHPQTQICDGFSFVLKSTILESNSIYVTFGLTAPDDIDLSSVLSVHTGEKLSFPGLLATMNDNNSPANISYDVADDGDGRKNTINVILKVDPIMLQGEKTAFDVGKSCRIEFKDIVKWGYDREYEQYLLATKYSGQHGFVYNPEEAARLHPSTLLASGHWIFEIPLTQATADKIELLESPVITKCLVIRSETTEYGTVDSIEDIKIISICLRPLSMEVLFEPPTPSESFECVFIDTTMFAQTSDRAEQNYQSIVLKMKDGTNISFFQEEGAKDAAMLNANSPIVLTEVDYLQMSDGTKVKIP